MTQANAASQRGLTLVEVLIALAVAGAILSAVLVGYNRVRAQSHAQAYVQALEAVIAAVDARYPRNNYTGLTAEQVIATPSFPRQMVSAAGTDIIGPEGGLVDVSVGAVGDWGQAADTAYGINFRDVGRSACETVVRLMAPRAARMAVNGTVVMARTTNAGAIDTLALRTQCAAAELHTVSVRVEP